MPSRLLRLTALAVSLACVGCLRPPTPATESTISGPKATTVSLNSATLLGQALVPVIAAGGGNVVAAGGGNVIAAGGGNVIAAGGGNVIAAGGGNYRVRATADDEELPVMGATVILRDPVTRKRIPWAKPVATDSQGRFQFEGLPARVNVLIEVVFVAKDRTPFRLLSLSRPGQAPEAAKVSWRSMALVTAMLDQAEASRGLYVTDPGKLATAEAELRKALDAESAESRAQRIRQAILVPTSDMNAPSGSAEAPALEVPDELPLRAVAGASTMIRESAERLPSLKVELERAGRTMAAAPSADDAKVVEAATALMGNPAAPTLTAGRIVYEPLPAASPSPSATPVPTRSATPTAMPASPSPTPVPTRSLAPITVLISPSPSPSPSAGVITRLSPIPSPTPTPLVIRSIAPTGRTP